MISHEDVIYIIFAIIGAWGTLQVTVGIVNYRVGKLEKDVDAIAEFVGTPRALAQKAEREKAAELKK